MKSVFTCLAALLCSICFSQDIILSGVTGSKALLEREEFVQSFIVKNTGIVNAGEFSSSFYFSADDQIDASDFNIGGKYLSGLAAGASATIDLPYGYVGVSPGTYNLIAKLDAYGYVSETDEGNNIVVMPGYVVTQSDIDLHFSSFTSNNTSYASEDKMSISCSVKNSGTTNLGGTLFVKFYLSNDAVLDGSDKSIDFRNEYVIGPDIFTLTDFVLQMPRTSAGNYYVIARADDMQKISEINEDNNIAVIPISVTSSNYDIELVNVVATVAEHYENLVFCQVTVRNNGSTGTYLKSYDLFGYLSPISGGNSTGGISLTGSSSDFPKYISPGETVNLSVDGYLMDVSFGDTYNLTVFINTYDDTNSANNNLSTTLYIPFPLTQSARFVSLNQVGSNDNTDTSLDFNLTVENNGDDSYFYQYYTLSILDASQSEVFSKDIESFLTTPGVSTTDRFAITLPAPLPTGNYTVKVQCQSACQTVPSSISKNFTITPIQYTLTGTLQGEDGVPLKNGKLFLYQKGEDGVLRFIQKITPTSNSFSFGIDNHQHTLYYVPDPATESEYVPTVYGKTITLTSSSLFILADDENVVFEIIKIQPLASGTGIISGFVTSESQAQTVSMRIATSFGAQVEATPESSVPVMLLSSSGHVVRLTYTDENGYYEFRNLPREEFSVMISRELDQPVMDEPYPVDITTRNMSVDFNLAEEDVAPAENILMLSQTVAFSEIEDAIYGDGPITLEAMSDSGLPVIFESSDPSIGEIISSTLVIRKPGPVTVTAKQTGSDFFNPATTTQSIIILKSNQTLTMRDIPSVKFGDTPVPLSATTQSGLPVTFESSDATIAEINGTTLVVKKPGSVTITAKQIGNEYYNPVTTTQPIEIQKAVRALALTEIPQKQFGDEPFTPESSGSSQLPTLHSSDTQIAVIENGKIVIKKPGTVTITAELDEDQFYFSSSDSRILSIGKGNQSLIFPPVSDKAFGESAFNAGISSSSSKTILFSSSDNSIAKIIDGIVSIHKPGIVTLTASQGSDDFYKENSASRTFVIKKGTQQITLPELPQKTYGDPAFTIGGKASSNLPLEVSISDESVVAFVFGNLLIRKAGTVSITVTQNGNDLYESASPVKKTLTISKANQTINFSEIPVKEVSDASFALLAGIDSPLKIEFSSDNEKVATVKGNVVSLRGAGVANITAIQKGNENYLPAKPVIRKLLVDQVTAIESRSKSSRVYPNPVHEYFQIDVDGSITSIQIIDALGTVQKDYDFSENKVDAQRLMPGVYFLIVLQGEVKNNFRFVKY
jgi:hypothetical protein